MMADTLDDLSKKVGQMLANRSWRIAVAESCTGGLLGSSITDTPGSSAYFAGGVIAYSNDVKTGVLCVSEQLISLHGAVSEPVASEMAAGCRRLLGTDVAIATTGVAGPGGGTASKPVGFVCVAVAVGNDVSVHSFQWSGTRIENKQATVLAALRFAADVISDGS